MSLTDLIPLNDEKEAIEDEYRLLAEKDAMAQMTGLAYTVTYVEKKWYAQLFEEDGSLISHAFFSGRKDAERAARQMFDDHHATLAEQIYKEQYAL